MVSISYQPVQHPKYFRYAALPKPVYYKPYRNMDENGRPMYGNIMYDKRVIRGNTWALRKLAQEALQLELAEQRKRNREKLDSLRETIKSKISPDTPSSKGSSKSSVSAKALKKEKQQQQPQSNSVKQKPKRLVSAQNGPDEPFSEELFRIKSSKERECQTDIDAQSLASSFISIAPPSQSDIISPRTDAGTQIDAEDLAQENVDTIVESLVNHSLGFAVKEMSHEEELALLRQKHRELEEISSAERRRLIELEQNFRASQEEKKKLTKEQERLRLTERRLASRHIALDFLDHLVPSSLQLLEAAGYLDIPKQNQHQVFQHSHHHHHVEDTLVVSSEAETEDLEMQAESGTEDGQEEVEEKAEEGTHVTTAAFLEANAETNEGRQFSVIDEEPELSELEAEDAAEEALEKIIEQDVGIDFLPWLLVNAESHVEGNVLSRLLSDSWPSEDRVRRRQVVQKLRRSFAQAERRPSQHYH